MPNTTAAAKKQVAAALLTAPEFEALDISEVSTLVDVLETVIGPFSEPSSNGVSEFGYYGIIPMFDARKNEFAADFVRDVGNEMFVKVGSATNEVVNRLRAKYNYQAGQAGRKIKTNRYGPLYHVQVVA